MRVEQPKGKRGSLLSIQCAVNSHPDALNRALQPHLPPGAVVTWLSPLESDDLAEYRDGSFLKLVGLAHLIPDLKAFWPDRGPQWDALARTNKGQVILVEAKAHIAEMCSDPSQASEGPRAKIDAAFESV